MKVKPYSSTVLALCGIALIGIGSYFIFLRPVILLEDARYIGASLSEIQNNLPGLSVWLQKVFWVMGGYILTTGVLTLYEQFSVDCDQCRSPHEVRAWLAITPLLRAGFRTESYAQLKIAICGAHLFSEAGARRVGFRCSCGLNLDWLDDRHKFYHSV